VFHGFDMRTIANFKTLPVPEPGSLSLVAGGVVWLLRRRKKSP
jgi:hypothetical protein